MPCKVFLRGDSDAVWLAAAADEVLSAVEQAEAGGRRFIRLDMPPYARDERSRAAYFDPGMVSAILPVDPREYEHLLDDPPEWLT